MRRLLAATCLAGLLAACGGGDPTPRVTASPSVRVPTSIPSSPPAPTPRQLAAVTLAFGGDIHFEGVISRRLAAGPATVMAEIAPLLKAADLAVVNLETAITGRGTPANKEFRFRAPPSAFTALRSAGVDVATVANNHGMDYGQVGLQDTLAAAEAARFPVIGIGRSAREAFAPYYATIRGTRIAVIGATQVLDDNLRLAWTATDRQPGLASAKEQQQILAAVRAARASADTVVVYLHWGQERATCPIAAQRALAPLLTAAGADIVVGSHAHVLLGTGRLGRALVSYGLGNFVFYARGGLGAQTGVLTVTVAGRDVRDYRWSPAVISNGAPRPLSGEAARRAIASWQRLRGCTGLAP